MSRRPFLYLAIGGFALLAAIVLHPRTAESQLNSRREIRIPDVPGYQTLKCDFHIHTVFSDGSVWPTVRVEEAWREGLDVISITDHIEYQPHKGDIPTNHNRSYELAKPVADAMDIMLIRGVEITRGMPPGHLNAIFIRDAAPLDTPDWRDALKTAADQGAFIFYNHPNFHHPEGKQQWVPEHDELVKAGHLHGVEVVNGPDYYNEVHGWCLERKLTMISNTDIHGLVQFDYDVANGALRPMSWFS